MTYNGYINQHRERIMSFRPNIELVRPCSPIHPRDKENIQTNRVYYVVEKSGCHLKVIPLSSSTTEAILVNINDFAPYRFPSVDDPKGFVEGSKVMAVQDITACGANIKRGDMFTIRGIDVKNGEYLGEHKDYYSGLYLEGSDDFQALSFLIECFMPLDIDRMIAI